jgi:crotonobetainyl-CoA:carnitine CoA-transferase CaiB-like acyl-CoA transferase
MGIFKARDGYINLQAVGTGSSGRWGKLCELMGRPDLIDNPKFVDDKSRFQNLSEVENIIEAWLQTFPTDDAALQALWSCRIPAGPVLSTQQVLNHPQIKARGSVRKVEYPNGLCIDNFASPWQFSETPVEVKRCPYLGEHNEEVLKEYLGYSDNEVKNLLKEGVLFEGETASRLKE